MNVGILGYGAYIPKYRLKTDDIASVWGKKGKEVKRSLGVKEKAVPSFDEDAVTLAYEAARYALKRAQVSAENIEVCFVGSESHPYAVNPTSTIVAEFLAIPHNYLSSDLEFACKAATTGIIAASSLIALNKAKSGIVIATDAAQAKPHDILEYTAAAAAVAVVLGKNNSESVAEFVDFASYSSDTPDFWRRDGVRFPSHGGRFTGEPAYYHHVEQVSKLLLKKTGLDVADFAYCIFHMPNGKFPRIVAKRLGFLPKQLAQSLIVDVVGNPYSASSLLGLSNVLDQAQSGDLIFMVSYGSGAGADGLVFKATKNIKKRRYKAPLVSELIEKKKYISYTDYLKYVRKI